MPDRLAAVPADAPALVHYDPFGAGDPKKCVPAPRHPGTPAGNGTATYITAAGRDAVGALTTAATDVARDMFSWYFEPHVAKRILFIGEIVGKSGVFCVKTLLPQFVEENNVDLVVADAEGATGGFGLGKNHSIYLHKLGIDVLTGGERIYYKKDMVHHIDRARYIVRPANYPPGNPGRGYRFYSVDGVEIAVVVLLGQAGFNRVHPSNPFSLLPVLLERIKERTNIVIVDFHATTSAEKYTMFHHADGTVAAVIGTHSRVQTADETVFPGGTAVICDAGRTGSTASVGGLSPKVEIRKFLTQVPERSQDAWKDAELQGVLMDVNDDGKAVSIERVKQPCTEVPDDPDGHGE